MDLDIIYRFKKHYEEAQQQANKTKNIEDIFEACSKLENLNKALGVLKYDCENLAKKAKEEYKAKIESVELDEEVAAYEKKVEEEEDERDEKEKKRKEKESERKRVVTQKKKESDEEFFEEWADKFKALKNIIPSTENNFTGKGKEKKFKAEFRRKGNLLLAILKTLN